MLTCIVNITLLTRCHSDMFQPSQGHLQEAACNMLRRTDTLLSKLNFTSGNSLCWPCCRNICRTPWRWPFEGRNMSEWHAVNKVVLTINVSTGRFFMWNGFLLCPLLHCMLTGETYWIHLNVLLVTGCINLLKPNDIYIYIVPQR